MAETELTDQQKANVEKNVRLILNQCHACSSFYSYSRADVFVQDVKIDFREPAVVEHLESLQFYKLNNENIELLRALYQAQDENGKRIVVELCSQFVLGLIPASAAQAFVFLARYHSFQDALKLFTKESPAEFPAYFLQLAPITLPALAHILRFDHSFIQNEELQVLCQELQRLLAPCAPRATRKKEFNRTVLHYSSEETKKKREFEPVHQLVNYVCAQASRIQYLRLRKELRESVNFEVNQDRDRLLDSLGSLGFSVRLTGFLKFAETEFSKAQDAFSYKTCIDQIRSFFAELLNETAEKIAVTRGETLAQANVDTKYPVQVRDYLERIGFFSQQFRTLVDGLYKFMSDEGTHTLGATREVARIARNIAIEIGLLITKRLQQSKAPI